MNRKARRILEHPKHVSTEALRETLDKMIDTRVDLAVPPTPVMSRIESLAIECPSRDDLIVMVQEYQLEIELMVNRVKMENGDDL